MTHTKEISKRTQTEMMQLVAHDDVLSTKNFQKKYLTWSLDERNHFHWVFQSHHFWGDQFIMPVFGLQGWRQPDPESTHGWKQSNPEKMLISGLACHLITNLEHDLTVRQKEVLSISYDGLAWLVANETDDALRTLWANLLLFLKEKRHDAIALLRQGNWYPLDTLDELEK